MKEDSFFKTAANLNLIGVLFDMTQLFETRYFAYAVCCCRQFRIYEYYFQKLHLITKLINLVQVGATTERNWDPKQIKGEPLL